MPCVAFFPSAETRNGCGSGNAASTTSRSRADMETSVFFALKYAVSSAASIELFVILRRMCLLAPSRPMIKFLVGHGRDLPEANGFLAEPRCFDIHARAPIRFADSRGSFRFRPRCSSGNNNGEGPSCGRAQRSPENYWRQRKLRRWPRRKCHSRMRKSKRSTVVHPSSSYRESTCRPSSHATPAQKSLASPRAAGVPEARRRGE